MAQVAFSTMDHHSALVFPFGVPVISQIIVLAQEKVGDMSLCRSKQVAVTAAFTEAAILTPET